jgi:hypothetical protein
MVFSTRQKLLDFEIGHHLQKLWVRGIQRKHFYQMPLDTTFLVQGKSSAIGARLFRYVQTFFVKKVHHLSYESEDRIFDLSGYRNASSRRQSWNPSSLVDICFLGSPNNAILAFIRSLFFPCLAMDSSDFLPDDMTAVKLLVFCQYDSE